MVLLAGQATPQVISPPHLPVTPGEADRPRASGPDAQSRQFFSSKDLVGAKVKGAQGETLGEIDALVFSADKGQVFAAVGIGDDRQALIPLQALKITPAGGLARAVQITLHKTKSGLQASPSVAENNWKNLDNPAFTERILRHYDLPTSPAAMGGGADAALGEQGAGAGTPRGTNRAPL